MSLQQDDSHSHHNHEDGDEVEVSLRDYVKGFLFSVILTALAFILVMGNLLGNSVTTALAILGLGAVQIVVHMVYFLHMNSKSEGGWTLLALMFTLILVVITLVGSIWVMFHLNANMMPRMNHDAIESIQKLQ